MTLCTIDDLKDYLLPAFITACEEQNPGICERTIKAVSGEIMDMVANRFNANKGIPPLIKYIASVIAAYRTAGAITTLINTEGATDNEWLPLQKEWKRATDLLDKLALGKITLAHKDEINIQIEDRGMFVIVTNKRLFDLKGF